MSADVVGVAGVQPRCREPCDRIRSVLVGEEHNHQRHRDGTEPPLTLAQANQLKPGGRADESEGDDVGNRHHRNQGVGGHPVLVSVRDSVGVEREGGQEQPRGQPELGEPISRGHRLARRVCIRQGPGTSQAEKEEGPRDQRRDQDGRDRHPVSCLQHDHGHEDLSGDADGEGQAPRGESGRQSQPGRNGQTGDEESVGESGPGAPRELHVDHHQQGLDDREHGGEGQGGGGPRP